jgi:hypothetical protein
MGTALAADFSLTSLANFADRCYLSVPLDTLTLSRLVCYEPLCVSLDDCDCFMGNKKPVLACLCFPRASGRL